MSLTSPPSTTPAHIHTHIHTHTHTHAAATVTTTTGTDYTALTSISDAAENMYEALNGVDPALNNFDFDI